MGPGFKKSSKTFLSNWLSFALLCVRAYYLRFLPLWKQNNQFQTTFSHPIKNKLPKTKKKRVKSMHRPSLTVVHEMSIVRAWVIDSLKKERAKNENYFLIFLFSYTNSLFMYLRECSAANVFRLRRISYHSSNPILSNDMCNLVQVTGFRKWLHDSEGVLWVVLWGSTPPYRELI